MPPEITQVGRVSLSSDKVLCETVLASASPPGFLNEFTLEVIEDEQPSLPFGSVTATLFLFSSLFAVRSRH